MGAKFQSLVDRTDQIKALLSMLGMVPDYSLDSVDSMESLIDKQYPLGHKPMLTTLVVLGYYFGDVIVKNIKGARWLEPQGVEDDDPFSWKIEIVVDDKQKCHAYPLERMRKFWFDRTDGLFIYCTMLQDIVDGKIDTQVQDFHFGDGYRARLRKIKKEE